MRFTSAIAATQHKLPVNYGTHYATLCSTLRKKKKTREKVWPECGTKVKSSLNMRIEHTLHDDDVGVVTSKRPGKKNNKQFRT